MHRLVRFGGGAVAVVALSVGGLSLPACTSPDATPPSRTVREAPTTSTSTTTLEQSYAIPDVIDAAYVNHVLAALEHVAGDVVRRIHATGQFTEDDLIPLRAIYNDPEFELQAPGYAGLVTTEEGWAQNPPGDNIINVTQLLVVRDDCIYTRVLVDASETLVEPPPPRTAFLELRPRQAGTDPQGLNPTPWAIQHEDLAEEDRCVD